MYHNLLRTVILAACLGFGAATAFAHAIVVKSDPPAGATLPGPDLVINLTYNVRIDRERSKLSLTGPDGAAHEIGLQDGSAPDQLTGTATGLAAGSYVLHWQVLASDGHITRGDVPFSIAP